MDKNGRCQISFWMCVCGGGGPDNSAFFRHFQMRLKMDKNDKPNFLTRHGYGWGKGGGAKLARGHRTGARYKGKQYHPNG